MAKKAKAEAPADERRETARKWLGKIRAAQTSYRDWHTRGKRIVQRYRDDRPQTLTSDNLLGDKRMNLLWSNVETLKPALYALTPAPVAQRRNQDKDPVGKWAAEVLERCLAYQLDVYDFDHAMKEVVKDYLLPGRGQIWTVYDPLIAGADDDEYLASETVKCLYVQWQDFLTNFARVWDEVDWCARRFYLTRDECKRQFGDAIGNKITLDHKPEGTSDELSKEWTHKATIYEIWDKPSGLRIFVSPGYEEGVLKEGPPPIRFDKFFPCPRPLTATTASDSIIPTPDFALYQDQADEIDKLTQKISTLIRALIVRGVYDAAIQELGNLLSDTEEAKMIPVNNWAVFAQGGGLKSSVDFMPLGEIIEALRVAIEAREVSKQALYEITGIGDIIRGASNPNETATAQSIKSQWGGLRIRDRQQEVQRFARDLIRLKAEVIAEQFSDETIIQMSGVKLLTAQEKQQAQQALQASQQMQQQAQQLGQQAQQNPQAAQQAQQLMAQAQQMTPPEEVVKLLEEPTWDEVLALLRNDKARGFAVDIETDSTIEPDREAERTARTEFLGAVSGFLGQAMEFAQAGGAPAANVAKDLLLFTIQAWPVADTMESNIEAAMEAMAERAANPAPSPDAQKAETDKFRAETDRKKAEGDLQINQEKVAIERERLETDKRTAAATEQSAQAKIMAEEAAAIMATPEGQGMVQTMRAMVQTTAQQNAMMLEQQKQMFAWLQSFTQLQMQNQAALIEAISAPKIVVRDAQGRVAGVETSTPIRQAAE